MLYRTHHPFFQFHPLSSIPHLPLPLTITPRRPLSSYLQAEGAEMKSVESASKKSSLRPEPLGFGDDFPANNVPRTTGVSLDEFFVDDLLDFSNDGMNQETEEDEKEGEKKRHVVSVFPQEKEEEEAPKDQFCSLPTSELSVPADDLADQEWLSHFVEDSFSLTYPAQVLTQKPNEASEKQRSEPEFPKPCFDTPVPGKARTKRSRTGGLTWSSRSLSGTADSSSSSASSTSSSTSSSPSCPWLNYRSSNVESLNLAEKPLPTAKKQKRKPVSDVSDSGEKQAAAPPVPRRCSHCGVQKTPQWRAGPLGAKTLCNACGVRFKSGRLLPEYRPSCSPTFSSDLHSNSHRKVLEMRRKNEVVGGGEEPGLASPVRRF